MKIEVLEVGSTVFIGFGEIEAVIIGVSIRGDCHHVTYECEWWSGKDRKSAWLESFNVKAAGENSKVLIGFASCQN